jgi:formiminotetrahydrofolate cyclodeaminase
LKDMQNYLRSTIEEYLRVLSERKIIPGGGSASALVAALGAGLNLMVINYSMGGASSGKAPRELSSARQRQQKSLDRLSLLVDEDCKAFQELMEALSSKRDAQKEYIVAAAVPTEICRECNTSIGITAHLAQNANRKLMTDIGCAAYILKAAFHSARLNVEVNLKHIGDRLLVESTEKELDTIEKEIDIADGRVRDGLKKYG